MYLIVLYLIIESVIAIGRAMGDITARARYNYAAIPLINVCEEGFTALGSRRFNLLFAIGGLHNWFCCFYITIYNNMRVRTD